MDAIGIAGEGIGRKMKQALAASLSQSIIGAPAEWRHPDPMDIKLSPRDEMDMLLNPLGISSAPCEIYVGKYCHGNRKKQRAKQKAARKARRKNRK